MDSPWSKPGPRTGGSESRQLLMIPSGLAFSPFSAIDPSLAPALSATSFVCGDLKSLHQNLLRHICIKGGLLGQSLLATFLHHLLNSLHMRMHFLGSSLLCYTEVSQVCVADACWKYIHFPISPRMGGIYNIYPWFPKKLGIYFSVVHSRSGEGFHWLIIS
jgi:hypothetical protein